MFGCNCFEMDMSYLYIISMCYLVVLGSKLHKKHVPNSIIPSSPQPAYNLTSWVRQLHLQQCVLVEIGEKYAGIYVEFREVSRQLEADVQEYFLGLCDTQTLRKWKFCSADLENERPEDCIFKENTELSDNPSRVHRRLCDVTGLAFHAELCNCNNEIDGQKLFRVTGFPTCFLSPLPESICTPLNVCGVAQCNTTTVNQQVHTVQCNPKCLGGQPFCEVPLLKSARPSKIESYWTDWSEDIYEDIPESNGFIHTEALCINKNTGMGALDCLGPGTNCCPPNTDECKCYIYIEDGILKLFRKYKLKEPFSRKHTEPNKNLVRQRYANYRKHNNKLKENHLVRNQRDAYYDNEGEDEDSNKEDVILEETQVQTEDVDVSTSDSMDYEKNFNWTEHMEMPAGSRRRVPGNNCQSIHLHNHQVHEIVITLLLIYAFQFEFAKFNF